MKSYPRIALALGLALFASASHGADVTVFTANEAGFHATSTLISGKTEAVLVDAQFTRSEARKLAATIKKSGKKLTTVFITHAHPDHHFGLEVILKEFPTAKAVTLPEVITELKAISPGKLAYWKGIYKDDLADAFIVPQALTKPEIILEGETLKIVTLKEGESEAAGVVYVPSAKTLIAGDVIFNGVHLWLAEGRPDSWLANLKKLKDVGPIDRIVSGHQKTEAVTGAELIGVNEAYIKDFQAILADAKAKKEGPEAAIARITAKYPEYALPVIAEIAFQALMAGPK